MKKLICICLILAMFISVVPAAEGDIVAYEVNGGYIYFDKASGTITDSDESIVSVVVPSEIEGVAVKTIGKDAFRQRQSLVSVRLSEGIQTLEDRSFDGCFYLTEIVLPQSLKTIGEGVFLACASLKDIALPAGLTELGESAFSACHSIERITIPEAITVINMAMFYECVKLHNVTILGDITSIDAYAFSMCNSLKSITLPASLTYVGEYAFEAGRITDVYFKGTAEQWNSIDFTKGNHPLTEALIHFADGSSFSDVNEDDYYADAVFWAVKNDITNGVSANEFAPEMICTRGQIVTFLWRAFGSPEPAATEHPFNDIDVHSYYYKAVLWAVENGITSGVSETEFAPEAFCTRGQAVTFLYRVRDHIEKGVSKSQSPFYDVLEGDYFFEAVFWAVKEGITNGISETEFGPNQNCTRGQIVTFLYRAFV